MNTFTISGQVKDTQSRKSIPNLRIEAWDKDLFFNDLVGSATTDATGSFRIEFSQDHFRECFLDHKPDLFFKVYRGRRLIASTEKSVLWNIEQKPETIIIEVDLPPDDAGDDEAMAFIVKGAVRQKDKSPLAGAFVRAVDKDLRHEQELGQSVTDEQGRYEIKYTRDRFRRAEKKSADLIVRVFDPATGRLLLAESEIIFNAGPVAVVDLIATASYSEYERYLAELTSARDKVALADLTSLDIEFLHHETGIASQHIEFLALAARLGKQTGLAPEVFYGLFRQGLPTDLSDLLSEKAEILRTALLASFKADIIAGHLQENLDDYLDALSRIKESDPGIRSRQEKEKLRRLIKIDSLDDAKIEKLVDKAGQATLVSDKLLNAMVEDGDLTEPEAKSLGLTVTLNNLLDDNLELVKTLKTESFTGIPQEKIEQVEDLAVFDKAAWLEILEQSGNQPPEGWSREGYAALLAKKIESLYPGKVMLARLTPGAANGRIQDINETLRLFEKNEHPFSAAFNDLDLAGLDEVTVDRLRASRASLKGLANTYPGLGIHEILNNPQLPADAKDKRIQDHVGLVTRFHTQNSDKEFLFLDYSPDSADIQALDFGGFSEDQQRMVLKTVKAYQRIYSVTRDSDHSRLLLAMGYHSPVQIAMLSQQYFISISGLDETVAKAYHDKACASAARSIIGMLGLKQQVGDLLARHPFDNTDTATGDYLKKIDGWEVLFGSLDYCRCEHCRSIFGPAAYFVDLMRYIQLHILDQFPEDEDEALHALHLKKRRPDLWKLPLTCEHTNELMPYLDIINEVMENFIALDLGYEEAHLPAPGVSDRSAVEDLVYETLQNTTTSFGLPFSLPLERLALYLAHFDLKRGDICKMLGMPDADHAAAALNLSRRGADATSVHDVWEYELTVRNNRNIGHLRQIYGLHFMESGDRITYRLNADESAQNDVQPLLKAMGLTRTELGELIETRFVCTGSLELVTRVESILIAGEKRVASGEDASVQNDIERIRGLTRTALDRMHRFTRLRRKLAWSIKELDLVLSHLSQQGMVHGIEEATLPYLVNIRAVQERFGLSIEEVCALWSSIPEIPVADGSVSLFDHLFNLPDFVRLDGRFPKPGHRFLHPALRDTPPDDPDYTTYRLTAGLNLDDQTFYQLIASLAEPLGVDPAADNLEDRKFSLSGEHLALLYRHARLAKKLGLGISELFALIAAADGFGADYISGLNDLTAFLEFYDWWRSTDYTLEDLASITLPAEEEGPLPSEAAVICEQLLARVRADQALIFNSNVFAFLEGVTETQSQDIVEDVGNAAVIAKARGARYRVADGFDPDADPGTAINLPADMSATPELQYYIFSMLVTFNAPGAVFDDIVFSEIENISLEQSRAIVAANSVLITEVPLTDLYWLRPGFPAATLIIGDDTPVTHAKAKALLAAYHAAGVIPTYLAAEMGTAVEKIEALLDLTGTDLSGPEYTRALQERDPDGDLQELIKTLLPLKILFKSPALDADAIDYIQSHPDIIGNLVPGAITMENIRLLALFCRFLKKFQDPADERQSYFDLLGAFISPADKFYTDAEGRDEVKDALAGAFEAEAGLVLTAHDEIKTLEAAPDIAPPGTALDTLDKLGAYLDVSQRLGVSGEVLTLIVSNDYHDLNQAANSILSAFRTKYDDEALWDEKIEPFDNKIRSRKRDALADYLIKALRPAAFGSINDLYHYFLLDVKLEGCARTSRLVAANCSLQLYVHRVLMHLEQDRDETVELTVTDAAQTEWQWRKNYRVWEANRKVFLYPENYLEPDLRDNKTPLFEALESTLLQQEINADTVLEAYAGYMRGFDEVASLKIAGSYHDIGEKTDFLHLFGVTAADPIVHYYRGVENAFHGERDDTTGVVWQPWHKIDVQIPVRKVSPIVFKGKLYVFWVEFSTRPHNNVIDGSSEFVGYRHTMSVKYTTLRLDGSWTPPQKISLDGQQPFTLGDGVIDDPLEEPSEREEIARERSAGRPYFHLLAQLLKPKYDTEFHLEPKDGYKLTGFQWERIYPHPLYSRNTIRLTGHDFYMHSAIDFYRASIGTRELFEGFDIYGRILAWNGDENVVYTAPPPMLSGGGWILIPTHPC